MQARVSRAWCWRKGALAVVHLALSRFLSPFWVFICCLSNTWGFGNVWTFFQCGNQTSTFHLGVVCHHTPKTYSPSCHAPGLGVYRAPWRISVTEDSEETCLGHLLSRRRAGCGMLVESSFRFSGPSGHQLPSALFGTDVLFLSLQ